MNKTFLYADFIADPRTQNPRNSEVSKRAQRALFRTSELKSFHGDDGVAIVKMKDTLEDGR